MFEKLKRSYNCAVSLPITHALHHPCQSTPGPSAMEQKPSLISGPAGGIHRHAHTFRGMQDARCVHYEPEFLMLPTVRTTEVSKAK